MSPPINLRPSSPGEPHNIVLIGLSGSGKSTVARLVGQRLGRQVVDLDHEIERQEGASISDLFEQRGEDEFRRIERRVVALACQACGQVIATGGGAILDAANRRRMWERNLVVYLRTSTAVLDERLAGADDRPLLGGERRARLDALERQRREFYEQAHAIVETDARSPEQVAGEVVSLL